MSWMQTVPVDDIFSVIAVTISTDKSAASIAAYEFFLASRYVQSLVHPATSPTILTTRSQCVSRARNLAQPHRARIACSGFGRFLAATQRRWPFQSRLVAWHTVVGCRKYSFGTQLRQGTTISHQNVPRGRTSADRGQSRWEIPTRKKRPSIAHGDRSR